MFIMKKMNESSAQKDYCKVISNDRGLEREPDMYLKDFLPCKSEMMYSFQDRSLYLPGEEFNELNIGNHKESQEIMTKAGKMPNHNFSSTLYENKSNELEMNEEDACIDLV